MPDYTGLVKAMKQAALDAVDAKKPVAVYYGTVTSESPLKIDVEQKMTLSEAQLVLTKAVLDHEVDIEVSHYTVNDALMNGKHTHSITDTYTGGGSSDTGNLDTTHKHAYKGRKKIMIYNGLKKGEKVLLIRFQEGQKFVVWDLVCDHTAKGEWL